MFLTKIKGQVDFGTFDPIGLNFARDKNRFYYGPGGKTIQTTDLRPFFNMVYKQEVYGNTPQIQRELKLELWKTRMAVEEESVYWDGILLKGVKGKSLRRVCTNLFADADHLYDFNLQKIKKIEGVDRDSFVYFNELKGNSIHSYATDKFKPIYCYALNRELDRQWDFRRMRPLFEHLRNQIGNDYWWYKIERTG